ncbi:MAG: dTDP-glucose 4,6-dehydratase [Candidatus Kerfeldbacteria bacterium]|nr:dTDP-glucose 4,6-dehydratase [Candidatus Kerfeldbacteria bacterium]
MNILLTGGLGFMGSNMVRYLLNTYPEYTVINLDKMTYAGNPENLRDVENNPRYHFVQGDIADEELVQRVIEQYAPDAIINYAAETHVDRSMMNPKSFMETDILGTHNLLEATRRHGISRMVHISTDEVYGSIEQGEFFEDSPFKPNNPYSASKAGGDHMCRAYWESYQTPVIVTHSCNFYGFYQHPEKVVPLFVTNLIEGKPITVHGNGRQIREWIFADDHCRAIDAILHKGCDGEIYNIGTGKRKSVLELAKTIVKYMDVDPTLVTFGKDRPGQDHRYATNFSKLSIELDWQPMTSFDEGIQQTIQWYQEHQDWWKKIKEGEFKEYYSKLQNMYGEGRAE